MPLSSKWLRPLDRKGHGVSQEQAELRHVSQEAVCRGCRGRGWKRVGSRSVLAASAADARIRPTSRRRCLDCDGTGKE
jgi:hypothetical protein